MTTTPRRDVRPYALPAYAPMVILLLLAGLAIEEGLRLLLTVDPAAQADMAGWYVLVLGLILAVTSAYAERPSRSHPGSADDAEPTDGADTTNAGDSTALSPPMHPHRDMTVFLLLVAAYAALIEPLGYAITGVLVVLGYLRVIAKYGWLSSIVRTLVMNTVFIGLFELAGVVLPAGILGF